MGEKCERCLEEYTQLIGRAGDVYKAADEHDWAAADMHHSDFLEALYELEDTACIDPGLAETLGDTAGRMETNLVRKDFKGLLENLRKIWTGGEGARVRKSMAEICQME